MVGTQISLLLVRECQVSRWHTLPSEQCFSSWMYMLFQLPWVWTEALPRKDPTWVYSFHLRLPSLDFVGASAPTAAWSVLGRRSSLESEWIQVWAFFLISYVLLGKFLNFTESQCFYKLGLIVPSSWGSCKDYCAIMSINCWP